MTAPQIGMQFSRQLTEPVPVLGADFSATLVIESSENASNAEFPIGQAKRFSTGETEALTALGSGQLGARVRGLNSELNGINAGADVTVVRIAEGEDDAETAAAIAEVIAGITDVASAVNKTPRIVVAGRTAWRPDLNTVNPVIAALQSNLGKILAIAPVDVDPTSAALAIDGRETMSSERLMPIGVAAKVWEGGVQVVRPMSSHVAGLFIRTDNENEGLPFEPIANRPLVGISGLSRKIPFSMLDGANEGQQMLAANVSIVAEGETGVDGAVANGGYVFMGTDNAATGELWEQIHQVRGTDYIITQIMAITRQFIGRHKITADMAEAWINSIAYVLRDHKAADRILGYTPKSQMFKGSANSPEDIRLGSLSLSIGIEPAPVFKLANHTITRWRPAVEGLVSDIVARLDQAA